MRTLTNEGRWTPEVLQVADNIVRVQGIPRVDAIEIARRCVARCHHVHVDAMPQIDADGGRVRLLLELGDARAWVWARAA